MFKLLALPILVLALLSPGSVMATLLLGTGTYQTLDDLTVFDDGSEWLDLSVTKGLDYNVAVATHASAGFRLATYAEVTDMWSSFGFDGSGYDGVGSDDFINAGDDAMRANFVAYFGYTYTATTFYSGGWYEYDGNLSTHHYGGFNTNSDRGVNNSYTASRTPVTGSYLVRNTVTDSPNTVPEPGTLALIGLGLLTTFGVRRRSKKG